MWLFETLFRQGLLSDLISYEPLDRSGLPTLDELKVVWEDGLFIYRVAGIYTTVDGPNSFTSTISPQKPLDENTDFDSLSLYLSLLFEGGEVSENVFSAEIHSVIPLSLAARRHYSGVAEEN